MTARTLANDLGIKPLDLIGALMEQNCFATLEGEVPPDMVGKMVDKFRRPLVAGELPDKCCRGCAFWRDPRCHRFPQSVRHGANYWCGEWMRA